MILTARFTQLVIVLTIPLLQNPFYHYRQHFIASLKFRFQNFLIAIFRVYSLSTLIHLRML